MRVICTIAILGLGLSIPATVFADVSPDKSTASGQKIVCKERRKTGTRFTTKICKSAAQWEKMAETNRANLKELVDRPHVKICGPNGCD